MLKPIVEFFERKFHQRALSILTAYIVAFIPILALVLFFYNQAKVLFMGLPSITDKLEVLGHQIELWLGTQLHLDHDSAAAWITENLSPVLDIPFGLLQRSFQSGTALLANLVLISLITYFLLLYRTAIKNFLLTQMNPEDRVTLEKLLNQIQKLTKRYMIGQGIVIIILGTLIGTGLWIIGVPYPFFWGFLAGFLEIIPYVGTSIGGILPFFYMLMISETLWQPWAVIGLYILVQQIEGNLISPNVMGSSIKINPLFIILGLFLGGYMWGISGMILSLPVLAISKEIFRSFDVLEPVSYLMEDGLSKKSDIFLKQFDYSKNRIFNLFVREDKDET